MPRRTQPLGEQLKADGAALSDRTLAQRLIRRLESEALIQPGARLSAACAPLVAQAAEPLIRALSEQYGARFIVTVDPARPRDRLDVGAA